MKQRIKSGLERLGFQVERIPPLAADRTYAINPDFEYVLAHYLRRRTLERPFFFVQVGAFDGVSSDPLHAHVVEDGWEGLLVEPQPRYFGRLIENYAGIDGLEFVNAAVDRQAGSRPLYQVQDDGGNPVDSHAGLSSFSRDRLLKWQGRDGHRAQAGTRIGSVPVRCVTFDELLGETEYVDLLHLDVEGYEFELLKLFDFGRIAPPIVRFEHAHLDRSDWDEAVRLLAGHGYRMLQEEFDTTAYRKDTHIVNASAQSAHEDNGFLADYASQTDRRVLVDPQEAIGGHWDELGPLQVDYLRRNGLRPEHRLLDVGCGTLRAGRHFIRYLEPRNYTGLDISEEALRFGVRLIEEEELQDKHARLVLNTHRHLTFDQFGGETFDFVLAQSVFTHLPPELIEEAFRHVRSVMHGQSTFFFTFQEAETPTRLKEFVFNYPFDFFERVARANGLALSRRTDYPHPRGQVMVSAST